MPCGKKPLVKKWERPKIIKVINPSRYEQNEASVKLHWKNVIRSLEASYKDDQFWKSQYNVVRDLLDPVIFHRITKIFNLPSELKKYEPPEQEITPMPSETIYEQQNIFEVNATAQPRSRITFSVIDVQRSMSEGQKEQSEHWTVTSHRSSDYKKIRSKSTLTSKSSKALSRSISKSRSFPKFSSKIKKSKNFSATETPEETPPESDDDLKVHPCSIVDEAVQTHTKNPHFEFLYCHESEADMIKWNSKFKQKGFEVSASDQFNKKSEIATKKIATEFYEWWSNLGTGEFKSEIRRPEDIEDLFQVWFDEHASRGLMLDPRILPCVNQSIADYVGVPKASCPKVLKRQVASDILAETSPAHTTAFSTCLPQHMKHVPPRNNTKKLWQNVQIPEDLRSMSCIWEDIQHLTSTKSFHSWLKQRPHLPMPPYLSSLDEPGEKKQLFVIPSDFVVKEKSSSSLVQELAFPVSEFTLELKEELSKIMNE